jgi:uncharacterized protein YdiU (UPF0061 family)
MIHSNRRFCVHEVESVGELVENVTQHTWTLCTGLSFEGVLFLNDSFSEDGAQEYAVVRNGRQIESLTVSWMSRGEAHNTIDAILHGSAIDYGPVRFMLDDPDDHHCLLCA